MPHGPRTQRRASDPTQVLNVSLSSIDPSPSNPRLKLRGIDELAASIAVYGLLQPLVVRPAGGRYMLLVGHRRFAAVQSLGWTHVAAFAREAGDDEAYLLGLIENLQRNDLSPREEAQALEVLLRERRWTTRQVASAVHRSAAYVSKRLRVFEDPVLGPLVLQRRLSTSAAEELLVLPQPERSSLAHMAGEGGWEHAEVRAAVRARFDSKRRTPAVRTLAHQLRQGLQGIFPAQLSDADRRELRLLFRDLAGLARGSVEPRATVFPPLPGPNPAR